MNSEWRAGQRTKDRECDEQGLCVKVKRRVGGRWGRAEAGHD